MEFRVWAPSAQNISVVLYENGVEEEYKLEFKESHSGLFHSIVKEARVGSLYKFKIDENGPFPDPASRFQPEGVHGPSQVINPSPKYI